MLCSPQRKHVPDMSGWNIRCKPRQLLLRCSTSCIHAVVTEGNSQQSGTKPYPQVSKPVPSPDPGIPAVLLAIRQQESGIRR